MSKKKSNLKTITMGIDEKEYGIIAGSDLCVLGEVVFNREKGTFTINGPKALGKSKEDIIAYLTSKARGVTFLKWLCAIGSAGFLIWLIVMILDKNKRRRSEEN